MSSPSPVTRAIAVLICDDSDPFRLLLSSMISHEPDLQVVGEARNGRDAIGEVRRLQPDVILLDLSMPIMTGLDALPAIKDAAPNARIIAFTGLSGAVVKDAIIAAGADEFVEKGVHPDVIVDTIKRVGRDSTRASDAPHRSPTRDARRDETSGQSFIGSMLAGVFSKR
jgi:DNA-binding NarL/FixJ family response regulator